MKKYLLYLPAIALLSSVFFACNEKDAKEAKKYREDNIAYYESFKADPDYQDLSVMLGDQSGPTGLLVKIVDSLDNPVNVYPFSTSKIKMIYTVGLYNDDEFQKITTPAEFAVSSFVRGISYAIQNMRVGDKWDIIVPYWLGYGTDDTVDYYTYQTAMKGFTTLHFIIELTEITRYPQ